MSEGAEDLSEDNRLSGDKRHKYQVGEMLLHIELSAYSQRGASQCPHGAGTYPNSCHQYSQDFQVSARLRKLIERYRVPLHSHVFT